MRNPRFSYPSWGRKRDLGQIPSSSDNYPVSDLDLRDKAILLVGFFGAFRRSEVVALEIDDLELVDAGMRITIRGSKTDQTGQGRIIGLPSRTDHLCTVAAVRACVEQAHIETGPLFPSRDCKRPLNARTVARIIKQWVGLFGLEGCQYAGHSLRAGFVTSAVMAGLDPLVIARQTGHRSMQTLARYVRPDSFTKRQLGIPEVRRRVAILIYLSKQLCPQLTVWHATRSTSTVQMAEQLGPKTLQCGAMCAART